MTLEAYLEALRPLASTGQKRRVWYGLGLLLSGALELLLYAEVAAQLVYPMPRQAANYLLQTMFWRFSLTELNSLLAASGSSSLLIPLTVIYWSSLFLIFPIAFFLAAVLKPVGGRKLFLYQRQILDVRELIDGLSAIAEGNASRRKQVLGLSRRTRAFYSPIPIFPRWYSMPEFQWLQPSFIDPRVRRIMKALSHADRALTNALERKLDVAGFVEPLKHLETFYFLSASRADPMLRPARSVASNRGETSQRQNQVALEMGELTEFARKVLPVVLAVTRGLKLRPSRGRWARVRDYYRVVTSQPIVRQAALLSGVAGVVMLVGTLVFRIRGDQAFLTWFTVTFGSLTVSVGITSVRLARGEIRETGKAKLT